MSINTDETRFYTFYSYKGGVGRTMALANVACQLANKHGHNVVCIDWDLEAPGLHYYFNFTDEELRNRAGLLDYLRDWKWLIQDGAKGEAPDIKHYMIDLKEKFGDKIKFGSVRLIHCGRTEPNYMRHVQEFDWNAFYEESEGFRVVEALKKQLLDAGADMILIDARAGQADIGTTPTIQIPDAVVLMFTCNRQNLEGIERIARTLHAHPMRAETGGPPKVLLVPARVFPREEDFQRWLKREADPVFKRLVEDKVIDGRDQPGGLMQGVIPVDAKWAVGERLAMLEARGLHNGDAYDQTKTPLVRAYELLAQALDNVRRGREAWSVRVERPTSQPPEKVEAFRKQIADAAERGDKDTVALLQYELAKELIDLQRLEEVESYLQSSLAHYMAVDHRKAVSAITHLTGIVRGGQARLDEAWDLFERALEFEVEASDDHNQSVTLNEMGNVRREQKRYEEAWDLFERALKLKVEAGDVREQSVTLHGMGEVRLKQERSDEAWDLFERALKLEVEAGEVRGQGATLHEMGSVRSEQQRYEEAWDLFERALAFKEESDDVQQQSVTLHAMGTMRLQQGHVGEARKILLCAKEKAQTANDAEGVAICEEGLRLCDEFQAGKKSKRKPKASKTGGRSSRKGA